MRRVLAPELTLSRDIQITGCAEQTVSMKGLLAREENKRTSCLYSLEWHYYPL